MFKLVKALGRLVGKLYIRQSKKLLDEARVLKAAQRSAEQLAARTLTTAKSLEEKANKATAESASVASQGIIIKSFFK